MATNLREFGIPALAAFLFLAFESTGQLNELSLTAFIITVAFCIFIVKDHRNELWLFVCGFAVGCIIEIGLRILGYQQNWAQASLFGVPYWLPIAWGVGFVLITRFGMYLRGVRAKD